MNGTQNRPSRFTWLVLGLISTIGVTGCALGVMAGKMLTGDPLQDAEFEQFTHVKLTKGDKSVLVLCTTPASVSQDLSSLNVELIDGITRRMQREGINVVDSDKVARWVDDNGQPRNPAVLAKDFKADYLIWIDITAFTFREENSETLLRGSCNGWIRVYRFSAEDEAETQLTAVYGKEFTSVYPPLAPIPDQNKLSKSFQKDYLDRVCDQIARKFYSHRPGWDI